MIHTIRESKFVKFQTEHYISPCIQCDGDDMKVDPYEDNFGVITTITCKSCKNTTRVNAVVLACINEWNNNNDLQTIITNKTLQIAELKTDIANYKAHLKRRNKQKKVQS